MDGSKKRRICGAAAFSATALVSILGAKVAGAEPAGSPPGLVQACEAHNSSPGLASLSFKQGWPSKYEGVSGVDCSSDGSLYNWWKKTSS